MARKKNIEKLREAIGGEIGAIQDGSASWVRIENKNFAVDFVFDGKGEKFKDMKIAKKIWQVVDEQIIIKIGAEEIK